MTIKHIMIKDLHPLYNAEYIANYFWKKEIAKVSSITILPYIIGGNILGIAYITFDSFCDSEAAKDFIYHMTGVSGYLIQHSDAEENNYWVLEPNTHNKGCLNVGDFTTNFMPEFFETQEDVNDYICGEDDLQCKYPIKDLKNNRYTVDEALSYLWLLNLQWEQETDPKKKREIAEQLYDIDSATKFHLMKENNEMNPMTIKYSEELIDVFGELGEIEWKNFLSWQSSPPSSRNEMIGTNFLAKSPPGLMRREVATSVDEWKSFH